MELDASSELVSDDPGEAPEGGSIAEKEEEVDDLDDVNEVIPFTYSITSYGADYPVDSLVKRVEQRDIRVPTFDWVPGEVSDMVGFQREYVWPRTKADRFIESLLLGLPVPGVFLVKEPSGILLVLDGHQRLHTLNAFYGGVLNGKEYRLGNVVQDRFAGKTYKDLDPETRRRLDDSIIHATVVRQDTPAEDQSSIYIVFERLNTGGVNLQPQEIRVALYHGKFVRVLRDLNNNDDWRALYGNKSKRLKDMEMILRFLAFFFYSENYESPMKDFLNRYMATNRDLERQSKDQLTEIFANTVSILNALLGHRAFRPIRAVNAAVIDSLMTGVARRLQEGPISDVAELVERYDALIGDAEYRSAIETGTSQEANVKKRLKLAAEAFQQVR